MSKRRPKKLFRKGTVQPVSFLMVLILISWILIIHWSVTSLEKSEQRQQRQEQHHISYKQHEAKEEEEHQTNDDDGKAVEIPGIEVRIPVVGQSDIQVVYTSYTKEQQLNKGIVLLLHACTHSALKFFSQSPETCPTCVGLSEELRMVRLILDKGYTPVAISSVDQNSGCWSNKDFERVQTVVNQRETLFGKTTNIIYAMGASSGGAFAAQLVTHHTVQAAVVMVMSLSSDLITKLQRMSPDKTLIYLAPMPKDHGTTQRAIQNAKTNGVLHLDTGTCQELPVTVHYLVQRVPGMSITVATQLIQTLQKAHHLDSNSMFIVDPTRSNWRNLLNNDAQQQDHKYWHNFALKPGFSPLAKALHRAWAFHEYCSEVVVPALQLFESQEQYLQK